MGFWNCLGNSPKISFFHPGNSIKSVAIQKPPSNDQLSRKPFFEFFRVLRESNARTEKGVLCQNLYVPPVGRTVCAHSCKIPSCNYRYSQMKQTDFQVDKVTSTIENTGHSTPCKCFWTDHKTHLFEVFFHFLFFAHHILTPDLLHHCHPPIIHQFESTYCSGSLPRFKRLFPICPRYKLLYQIFFSLGDTWKQFIVCPPNFDVNST